MKSLTELHIHSVSKRYASRRVLSDVELTLHSGQCYLLSGENGAGKTTLLRILAGLERPDSGLFSTGLLEGNWRQCRKLLQTRILYLHQQPYMFDGSVRYNLAYALNQQLTRQQRKAHIQQALAWAGLEGHAQESAKNLSGGERQRVALTRAWLRRPDVLLLDEPTSNLDQESRKRTLALLDSLRSEGISLLIASHDQTHFSSLIDSHILLQEGGLIHLDPQEALPDVTSKVIPLRRTHA